jgi:peptidoglycan/LPS O-acetylase OafA/YrhL
MAERAAASSQKSSPASLLGASRFYRPELDLLRFFAFVCVFIAHSPHAMHLGWMMDAGSNAVCLFFLLSAFLITELLLREQDSTGSIHLRAFYIRRILRIWPAYLLGVGAGVLAGTFIPAWRVPLGAIPWLLLGVANIYIQKHGWMQNPLNPLWSLAIEEQFYLILPVVAKFGGRTGLRTCALVCFPVAYLELGRQAHLHASPNVVIWPNSFVQFQFFAVGILIALTLHNREWTISDRTRWVLLFGGILGLVAVEKIANLHRTLPISGSMLCAGYLSVLLSCVLLFLAFYNMRVNASGILVQLGRISYGLYIYHVFFLPLTAVLPLPLTLPGTLLRMVCAFGLTILAALLSWHIVEKPFLRLRHRFTFIPNRSV